jgi:thiosulfate reductase cytochrome b subunit
MPRAGLPQALPEPAASPSPPTPTPTRAPLKRRVLLVAVVVLVVLAAIVLIMRWGVNQEGMRDFLATYPGTTPLPSNAPVGLPVWLEWQHFLNSLFLILIIRTGWQIRTDKRPRVFWTTRRGGVGARKISLTQWFHQSLDLLWVVNGVVFFVLLFTTGQWMRIVPTNWAVFPNALSALVQYVSLDWPMGDGWTNYNSLQVLAYFATVFLAAPLAIATGLRMSHLWPARATRLSRAYPIEVARAIHFPVMLYFVLFVIVHVTLVIATGALRNLNHMYAAQDVVSWTGFWIFWASLVVIAGVWIAAKPVVLAPIARLFGTIGR